MNWRSGDEDTDYEAGEIEEDDAEGSLLPCPSCGESVYDDTDRCPHCGDWIMPLAAAARASRWWWPIVVLIVIVGLLTLLIQ